MKYFEKNKFDGNSLEMLHSVIGKISYCVSSNLFFKEVHEEAETERHRVILAKSVYSLIAVCEAIAELVPEDEREKTLEEIRKEMEPSFDNAVFRRFLDIVFGE